MNSITLYFVARFKHDRVQGLESGPFITWDAACEARYELEKAGTCSYVVVRAEIPATVEEVD